MHEQMKTTAVIKIIAPYFTSFIIVDDFFCLFANAIFLNLKQLRSRLPGSISRAFNPGLSRIVYGKEKGKANNEDLSFSPAGSSFADTLVPV
jgi:hypothetical protein